MIYLFFIVAAVNISFWLFVFSKLSFTETKEAIEQSGNSPKSVKVVIAVRNEEENIKKLLDIVLEQDYPAYKVLVVDDCSTDGTMEILKAYKLKYNHLEIHGNKDHHGKKQALHSKLIGENASILVFTDGDCRPASRDWLKLMLQPISNRKEVVLGYGPNVKKNTFFNKFVRFETLMTAIQYFSYALAGIPYMGVGRNLAYKKKLFDQSDGFSSHLNIKSGDDDLFVNQVANKRNIAIQISPDSFVYSEGPSNLVDFIHQKKRHVSTAVSYKFIHQFLLTSYALSLIGFYLLLFVVNFKLAVFVCFTRWFIILIFNSNTFIKLKEKDLLFYFPLLDFLMALYYIFMSVYSLFPRKNSW